MAQTQKTAAAASDDAGEALGAPISGSPALGADELPAAHFAAVAQANAALVSGFEALSAALYSYARESISSATSTARSMIDARGLTDVVALHHDFAKTALEELITNTTRVAEIGVTATGEALKPFGVHVADTIAKLNRPPKL
jgi:phasin family protein